MRSNIVFPKPMSDDASYSRDVPKDSYRPAYHIQENVTDVCPKNVVGLLDNVVPVSVFVQEGGEGRAFLGSHPISRHMGNMAKDINQCQSFLGRFQIFKTPKEMKANGNPMITIPAI